MIFADADAYADIKISIFADADADADITLMRIGSYSHVKKQVYG